ncbi:MAG: hypothetical protein ACOYOK_06845 [Pseudobdellovibrionaceae bacterium]
MGPIITFVFLAFGASMLISDNLYATCTSKDNLSAQGVGTRQYLSAKNPSQLQIIVLPPTGGENKADRILAANLCRYGYNTVILNYKQEYATVENIKSHDQITQHVLLLLNDFLQKSSKKTVLVGASLGGLYASVAFGLKDQPEGINYPGLQQIQGIITTVAGGPLYKILSDSQLDFLLKLKQDRMRFFNLKTSSDYLNLLQSQIFLDPLQLAQSQKSKSVKMFISDRDTTVPSAYQEQLWQAWGQPQRVNVKYSHVNAIAKVYLFNGDTIYQFAKEIF